MTQAQQILAPSRAVNHGADGTPRRGPSAASHVQTTDAAGFSAIMARVSAEVAAVKHECLVGKSKGEAGQDGVIALRRNLTRALHIRLRAELDAAKT